MYTYQDLLECSRSEDDKKAFILRAINQHKASKAYLTAMEANEYYKQNNTAITNYQKILYTVSGRQVQDVFAANHKCASNYFFKIVCQTIQYSLGNGLIFGNNENKAKFEKDIDLTIQELFKYAAIEGVSFGFYNNGQINIFKFTEFVPLWDEEDGSLKAGIRFWQVDSSKPLRCTLFELGGYTEYKKVKSKPLEIMVEKQKYIKYISDSEIYGTEIYDGENYPTFPIIPAWIDDRKQSLLCGIKEEIDAYDFIKSGFANDLDDCTQIYWLIQNAGGMDDVDLAKFMNRLKTLKIANVDADENVNLSPYTVEVPYQSREVYLERLEKDIYNDSMSLDVASIQSGNITATQIKACYENLNLKADMFEAYVLRFMHVICDFIGIDDTITFNRSKILNTQEEIATIISTGTLLPDDYKVKKILTLLGDTDMIDSVLEKLEISDVEMYRQQQEQDTSKGD